MSETQRLLSKDLEEPAAIAMPSGNGGKTYMQQVKDAKKKLVKQIIVLVLLSFVFSLLMFITFYNQVGVKPLYA